MSLWRRDPQAIYRVYDEDAYPDGDDAFAGGEAEHEPGDSDRVVQGGRVDPVRSAALRGDTLRSAPRSRVFNSRRLPGLGLLVGVTVGALGLVALDGRHQRARPMPTFAPAGGVQTKEPARSLSRRDRHPRRGLDRRLRRGSSQGQRSQHRQPRGRQPRRRPSHGRPREVAATVAVAVAVQQRVQPWPQASDEFGFER